MRRFLGGTLLFIGLVVVAVAVLPFGLNRLPGRYLVRLQAFAPTAKVVNALRPVPDALPAPQHSAGLSAAPTFSPTPLPTATPLPPSPTVPSENKPFSPTAAPTQTPLPTPTATAIPARVVLADVPVIPQAFSNCGPANLALTLNFLGDGRDQMAIAARIRPYEEDRNVSPWELRDFVNGETGLRAFAGAGGDLALVRRLVAAGFPVILQRGYDVQDLGWFGHYLTVYGYDSDTQQFFSRDTSAGPFDGSPRLDSAETLSQMWSQFNRNFVVIYPREAAALVEGILGAEMVDEQMMWKVSAEAARKKTESDAVSTWDWFNLGTSLTHLGDYAAAAHAFDEARLAGMPPRMLWYEPAPFIAYLGNGQAEEVLFLTTTLTTQVPGGWFIEEVYYYRGLAFQATGDAEAARTAFERAVTLNAHFQPALAALGTE